MAAVVDDILIGTAVAGAASQVASGIAQFGADTGGSGGRFYFNSPELELDFINRLNEQLGQYDQEITRLNDMQGVLIQRNATQRQYIEGTLPREAAIREMSELDAEIAKRYGNNTLAQLGQGFLDAEDRAQSDALEKATREEYDKLAQMGPQVPPEVENAWRDKEFELRGQLSQQLGPGWETSTAGQQAIQEFNKRKQESFYSVGQDFLNQATQRAVSRVGLLGSGLEQSQLLRLRNRQQNLAEVGFMDASRQTSLTNARNYALQGSDLLRQLNLGEFQAGVTGSEARSNIMKGTRDIFAQFGQTDFTDQTRRALETGLVGPGSIYQQTGIPGQDLDLYRRAIMEREQRQAYTGSQFNIPYGSERDNNIVNYYGTNPIRRGGGRVGSYGPISKGRYLV